MKKLEAFVTEEGAAEVVAILLKHGSSFSIKDATNDTIRLEKKEKESMRSTRPSSVLQKWQIAKAALLEGATLEQAGRKVGVTRERVRQYVVRYGDEDFHSAKLRAIIAADKERFDQASAERYEFLAAGHSMKEAMAKFKQGGTNIGLRARRYAEEHDKPWPLRHLETRDRAGTKQEELYLFMARGGTKEQAAEAFGYRTPVSANSTAWNYAHKNGLPWPPAIKEKT